MKLQRSSLALVGALLLVAAPIGALAQQEEPPADGETLTSEPEAADGPYVICADGVCRITDEPPEAEPDGIDGEIEGVSATDDEPPQRLVCGAGEGSCTVVPDDVTIEDLRAASGGRLVHGAVESDPSGTWRTINLPARVKCTITGSGTSSLKLKRTRGQSTIEQQADGNLIAQSRREGEKPFVMVRLGPGLFGSLQPFTDGKVRGMVVSYFGQVAHDRIEGTAVMMSTLRDGGARTDCSMTRNFDMKRISAVPTEAVAETDAVE